MTELPLVVIVENNQFAYSTPIDKQMPVSKVSDRAPAFNIYSDVAFGNDLFQVIRTARKAIEHARSGEGPALVERDEALLGAVGSARLVTRQPGLREVGRRRLRDSGEAQHLGIGDQAADLREARRVRKPPAASR